jgi:hypothetical protein
MTYYNHCVNLKLKDNILPLCSNPKLKLMNMFLRKGGKEMNNEDKAINYELKRSQWDTRTIHAENLMLLWETLKEQKKDIVIIASYIDSDNDLLLRVSFPPANLTKYELKRVIKK